MTAPVVLPRLMRARSAAAYLGLGETTFRALGLPSVRHGGCVLWDRTVLDAWADSLSDAGREDTDTCDALFGVNR